MPFPIYLFLLVVLVFLRCAEKLKKKTEKIIVPKGQIISKCPYAIIVYPKIETKKFPRFLP